MKPYTKNSSIRVRNKRKYNSVPRKVRRTGFKVANPTKFWDFFSLGGHVIKKRFIKSKKRLVKDTYREYWIDKL